MAALRKAIRSLGMFYEGLSGDDELKNASFHHTLFPYCTSFECPELGTTRTFRYKEHLEKTRLVFFGELTDDQLQICIKFVRQYSCDAHKHCASSGFAPKLRGFERLPSDWYMVVMDRLCGYEPLSAVPETEHLPQALFESIGMQLQTLHAQGLVHGDLRDSNIMVGKEDRTKFMIIDFDWAGAIGSAEYPPNVNRKGIQRPEGARDGLPILASHDNAMLQNIFHSRHQS